MTGGPVYIDDGSSFGRQPLARNWNYRIRFSQISDGSSNTFLAGEIHIPDGKLNEAPYNGAIFNGSELDGHSRIGGPGIPLLTGSDVGGAILGFGSSHPSGCNFVRADGSTRTFSSNIDTVVLANLCHRADGEVIGAIQ